MTIIAGRRSLRRYERSIILPSLLALGVTLAACTGQSTVPQAPSGASSSPVVASASPAPVSPVANTPIIALSPVVGAGSGAASGSLGAPGGLAGAAQTGASPGVPQKVDVNRASRDEVARVLTANGVPNAARWAREVEEYRPYPINDPTYAKLRQELAKYNPAPEVVEQIIASLSL